jgi:hypothetical protein
MKTIQSLLVAAILTVAGALGAANAMAADPLAEGFASPPASAKPFVWWHWMNGNITQEGITHDLEWMHRIGIGGFQNFDAALGTPQVVKERLVFMTPPWRDAFRHAVQTADRLGLEMSIAGSPGWSESGGPWVTPEEAMKKLVWSETRVTAGKRFHGALPSPPSIAGRYQDQPLGAGITADAGAPAPDFYRDVAVIAFAVPAVDAAPLQAVVSSSAGPIDATLLSDGHLVKGVTLPFPKNGMAAWLRWDLGRPRAIRGLTLAFGGTPQLDFLIDTGRLQAELQASDDGVSYRSIAKLNDSAVGERTMAFDPVTARYFRLELPTPPPSKMPFTLPGMIVPTATEQIVTEAVLHLAPRVNRAEEKAAFFIGTGLDSSPTPDASAADVISGATVIDLTSRVHADGSLDWIPPKGTWTILRFGYSLIGITNHPASPEGTGLEVDKLSRKHVKAYLETYLDRYAAFLGPDLMGARGLHGMVNDSWEAGAQNWTEALPQEFQARRGYAMTRWLPVLTGRVVDSAASSDAFLWDFRRTLGELLTENHYGQLDALLKTRGMIHYVESHESGRAFIGDGMDAKRTATIPMSATWVSGNNPPAGYDADVRESASVAHLYGQNLVAAESLTTAGPAFAYAPADLKATADRMLSNGLNRFVIHTSVHQPLDDKAPGFTLGPFGQYFTRQETWAEQAGAWISYLARSAYLLQQGRYVADVLYYYGEDSNITALYGAGLPSVPAGYAYDFANAHALTLLHVQNGALTTASGMSYRVLVLDPRTRWMSLDVLRCIASLVSDGATVVGNKPQNTPSLADDASEFHRLADAVWGSGDTSGTHKYGKGQAIRAPTLADAMTMLGIAPDFSSSVPAADAELVYVHRHLDDGDLYYVSSRKAAAVNLEASFRVAGKAPELWYADTGRRAPASYRIESGRTIVALPLEAQDAVFVVFRQPATNPARRVPVPTRSIVADLEGPWQLTFQSGRGAPSSAVLPQLASWTTNTDAGIRYFSGTAVYHRNLPIRPEWLATGSRVDLDLGAVKSVAEVRVNGHSVGVLWKAPYRIDLTDVVKVGANDLEIGVTNLWPNRMIGDKQPGAAKITFATLDPYTADSPLLASGLLGPVRILTSRLAVQGNLTQSN